MYSLKNSQENETTYKAFLNNFSQFWIIGNNGEGETSRDKNIFQKNRIYKMHFCLICKAF